MKMDDDFETQQILDEIKQEQKQQQKFRLAK